MLEVRAGKTERAGSGTIREFLAEIDNNGNNHEALD
jgi:hypothetical protein